MSNTDNSAETDASDNNSFIAQLITGGYGLAITYWAFYFLGAALFFIFGSQAVDNEQWVLYLILLAMMLAYTTILVIGVRAAYRGPQLWKVISRTSSVFMIINILVGICTLGFIY